MGVWCTGLEIYIQRIAGFFVAFFSARSFLLISLWPRTVLSFRLVNLQVDASSVLGADNTKQGAKSFGGLAFAADNLTKVLWIEEKGDKHAHLINLALGA